MLLQANAEIGHGSEPRRVLVRSSTCSNTLYSSNPSSKMAVAVAGPHAEIAQTAARARAQYRSSGGSARHVALPGVNKPPRAREY